MDSTVVVPITLWNASEPVFRISTISISPNFKKLITGSHNGQLCLWDLDLSQGKITPRNLLIGHKDSVTCMSSTDEYVISTCEGRVLCRWSLDDGYCTNMNASLFIHRKMHLFLSSDANEEFLFTCGDYPEIFVIHSFTLQVISIIRSESDHVWISNFQVTTSGHRQTVSAITIDGCVKMWPLEHLGNDAQNETDSRSLPVSHVVDFSYDPSLTRALVVCKNSWLVYDSDFSNCLCRVEGRDGDSLSGGNFCDSNVIVWTRSGNSFLYTVSNGAHQLISVFLDDFNKASIFEPAFSLVEHESEKYLLKGDSQGRVTMWKADEENQQPVLSAALADGWITNENGFFNSFVQTSQVTCCIYVLEMDRFFVGCLNGSIVAIPATESITSFYFQSGIAGPPPTETLIGHRGKINCLLYPHEKYPYFNRSHLVSGGSDFSVCLWDVFKAELLFKFCVQSGEILKLIVPPRDCNPPVRTSVCSVSSDHSVAILNLNDERCLILTSRHEFPVVTVHWKPLDDFIIIECFDGTIYVWQMQTGHLDRVLNGVVAQEVIYACNESEPGIFSCNFYIRDETIREDSIGRGLFRVQETAGTSPFSLSRFLTSEISESHLFVCDLETALAELRCKSESETLDCSIVPDAYVLTKALTKDFHRKTAVESNKMKKNKPTKPTKPFGDDDISSESELRHLAIDGRFLKLIQFFLSSFHFWGLDQRLDEFLSSKLGLRRPKKCLCFGLFSYPGVYSLFLPSEQNSWRQSSSFLASVCVTIIALSKILLFCAGADPAGESFKNSLEDFISFYELACSSSDGESAVPRPNVQVLAKAWQHRCPCLRKAVRKVLCAHLQRLTPEENASLLAFWYRYLPHFKILDKTLPEKVDFENADLKTVALVLFGAVGSDFKFKSAGSSCQENYIYQTCAAFVYLLLLPNGQKSRFATLQTIAVDFIGRGYIVWEQFLKIDKVIPVLFKMCAGVTDQGLTVLGCPDKSLSAYDALKDIAIARTAAFINCLKNEIGQIRTGQNLHFLTGNSKPEILSIMTFLLEKTPYIMLLYLNDVISLIVYCIDLSHLRQENLSSLIPVIQKFRQVHHSVTSQKIAVGLPTGAIMLHDLKTGRLHDIPAHKDSVSALKFSEDGRSLVSYCCYENRLSFWHVLTGIFGLGNVHVKCAKSCKTYEIHDEKIKNHLEIASLTWIDKKSVMLSLCDGTEDVFHS